MKNLNFFENVKFEIMKPFNFFKYDIVKNETTNRALNLKNRLCSLHQLLTLPIQFQKELATFFSH